MPEREPQLHICIDGTFDYTFTNKETLHYKFQSSLLLICTIQRSMFLWYIILKKLASRRDELL